MKSTMSGRFRRNAAVIAAASIVGALGIGGLVGANAADNDSSGGSSSTTQTSDGDGEVPDAQENEADQKNDGPEQNEADEVDEADEGPEQGETADDQSDGETNDDATDTGPDADPTSLDTRTPRTRPRLSRPSRAAPGSTRRPGQVTGRGVVRPLSTERGDGTTGAGERS